MSDEDILYELKELHQWKLDREQQQTGKDSELTFLQKFNIRKLLPEKNTDISEYYLSQLPWQFAVPSKDRTLLAVLQENFLEIRHARDDYQKPIGRTTVPKDGSPKWRKLAWSSDGVYIALATSNGELRCYNTLTALVCSIPKIDTIYDSNSVIPSGAVVALFLIEMRTKSAEWPYELLAIDFYGNLRSYFVSSTLGYEPYHTFFFGESLLTAATYVPSFNILILAFPSTTLSPKSPDDTLGLSSWRLLIDHPYYRLVKPSIENLCLSSKSRKWITFLPSKNKRTVVVKMSTSLNVRYLACMHSCGTLSVWSIPQLTIHHTWHVQDLYRFMHLDSKKMNAQLENAKELFVSDISWCLDTKLAALRKNGSLTVSGIESVDNLLARINPKLHTVDRQPEFLNPLAQLANVCDMNAGFLMLDCSCREFPSWRTESEVFESSSDTKQDDENLSSSSAVEVADNHSLIRQILKFFVHFEIFQQQKKQLYVEKTYRLSVLKNVTPVELYEQKINSERYEEALDFAKLFNLDENRVYKKQWLSSSPVTVELIEDSLLKITDKKWIIYQCCERIPEAFPAAQTLLNKGLEFTDFSEFILDDLFLEFEDGEFCELTDRLHFEFNFEKTTTHFTKNQLHIFELRKHLLSYWDALTVYAKIIELDPQNMSYDPDMYRKFRLESPLSLALYFARDGNAEAVHIFFTYYGEEISPFWLEVLDNLPECVPPSSYKKLLPKFNEQNKLELWQHKLLRQTEWSESGEFKDFVTSITYKEQSVRKTNFPFSKKEVTEWYEKKVRNIVEESGLVDYALELLNLACNNNISSLEDLRHNLLVLDKLMYELRLDEEYSVADIEKLSESQKLVLLMSRSDTVESFRNAIPEIMLPFLNRCETLRSNSRDRILDAYFKKLSENDLILPLTFFEYVFEKDKNHSLFSAKRKLELRLLCIHECKRMDQTDVAFKIVEFEPEFSDNNNSGVEEMFALRSRLTELHTELVIMQLLRTYGVEKSVAFLHTNKTNSQFQKDVFTAMVNSKINTDSVSKKDIHALFSDMTFIQENVFISLPRQTYLRVFAYTMLTFGRTDCIEKYAPLVLRSSPLNSALKRDDTMSYEESVLIVVEAAQYYFNIASSYEDPSISLAKSCLSLICSHPDIEREKKLINALKDLKSFGVHIPPLKVRMCVNNTKIVEKVLKANPTSYKKVEKLLSLTKNLRVDEGHQSESELEVWNLAIDAAFQNGDHVWCSARITKLVESNKSCWSLCKMLCKCDKYDDLDTKQKLIKYALIQCPDKEMVDLVKLRNDIECRALQKRLRNSLESSKSPDDDEVQTSGIENEVKESPCQKDSDSETSSTSGESLQALISVPALMNMLHTSSSQVLNVSFWKNTFNFSFEGIGDKVAFELNTDCQKLGFPEFYADLHKHDDCICFNNQKPKNKTELFQLLLRYYLLRSRTRDVVDDATLTDINDVIAQLAVTSFPGDCLTCLSLLLLYRDTGYSEKVFSSLPSTTVVEKFALYYYSLQFLISRAAAVHDLITEESPSVLVFQALDQTAESDSPYVQLMNSYMKAIEKRRSVNKLRDLGCGIDSQRFFADETYKVDSVLGLALYEERDKLDLALSLGVEYGVCSVDIMLSHVSSLFLSRNLTLLTERLKEPIVVNTLKQKPAYAAERLVADVYDGLFGCDYQILLLYYALLNQIAEKEVYHHMKPKEHMKLLRKLKSSTKSIDYKLLTSERLQIVEAVMPAVFSNEIKQVTNLLVSLPPCLLDKIHIEDVYEQLADKVYFNGPASLSHTERFRVSMSFLEKIDESRAAKVLQKCLFSKYSCENIDTNTRQNILDVATKFYSQKQTEDGDSEMMAKLGVYRKQFSKIIEFIEICRAVDVNEVYLRELETPIIFDDREQLRVIVTKMVLDSTVSTEVISVILEFVRMDSLTDLITDMLSSDLDDSSENIKPLLCRIENSLEDNEYERCWSDSLVSLLKQKTVSEDVKTYIERILSLLEKPDEQIYTTIELLHETRLIMREWTSVQSRITLFDVATEETRLKLVKKLVPQIFALVHFTCVYKLLVFWPLFAAVKNWENDPWLLLMERLLSLYEGEPIHDEELKLLQKIMGHVSPSVEIRRAFFNHIGNVPHSQTLLVWFCALTNDQLLIQSVDGYTTGLLETKRMPKLVEEYLRKRIHK